MLGHELVQRIGQERPLAGEQLLIKDRQAVLIGKGSGLAVKNFRGAVNGIGAALMAGLENLQVRHLAEIADFNVPTHQEKISWLEVPVRDLVLAVHEVENLGRLFNVTTQLGRRNSLQALGTAYPKARTQILFRQLHDRNKQ